MVLVKRKKKYVVYDKNGKVVIITYHRKIAERFLKDGDKT